MRALTRGRDEGGQALIIALAFMSLFGLFIAVVLEQGFVNVRTGIAVQSRADKVLAADGGIEHGVWRARNTSDSVCPTVAAGEQILAASLPLNGKQATVKCSALAGQAATAGSARAPAGEQWAVVAGNVTTVGGGSPVNVVGGDASVAGLSLGSALTLTQGDFLQRAADCTGVTPPALLTPITTPDLSSCTGLAVPDVPHVLPAVPPVRTNPGLLNCASTGQDWAILHPGTYRNIPGQTFDLGLRNYLESGVYYLENYPVDFTERVVIGGQPPLGSPETSVLNAACPTINDGHPPAPAGVPSQASGNGVLIVLGGTSSILVRPDGSVGPGNSRVELYTRVRAAGESYTPGITLLAVPFGTAGYLPSTPLGSLIQNGLGAVSGMAVHGLVYAPQVLVTIAPKCTAPLRGGVFASQLTLLPGTCTSGPLEAVRARGRRTLVLTSTAATPAASGEIAITEQAVVKVANDPARTATVRSWRAL